MNPNEYATNSLIQPLKQRGYKKNRTTWYKDNNEITIIFNLQKSQYSGELWYYNFGIGFNIFFNKPIKTISMCDIIYRLSKDGNEVPISKVVDILDTWEKYFGSIEKLREQAIKDKIPPFISGRAKAYLISTSIK